MMLTYDYTNGAFDFRTEDSTATHSIQSRTNVSLFFLPQVYSFITKTFLGKPFNVYLSVNLASGSNQFSVGGLMDDGNGVAVSTSLSYGTDWVFDSSLRISICADDDGTSLFNSIECMAENLKVVDYFYPQTSIIDFSNIGLFLLKS